MSLYGNRPSSSESPLSGSQSYIWFMNQTLGQGATASVYIGRHKKTGDEVAVKAFNFRGDLRSMEVQKREFDVLKKLEHTNIIKLLAIEQETSTRKTVLVMELCREGSLYNVLDNPENMFGLAEEEFLTVVANVTEGMKYLREQNVVHRDIKPGNIMRTVASDGGSVYKLTDFGAARELQDDETFESMFGTPEFLHPDIFEKAVLRRSRGKPFNATVDLWSMGVTFYQVAAGHLPFRPYGGRRNAETMFHIITEKESGVISGVQKHEEGLIEWCKELPKTCRLSQGLRNYVVPIIAKLMECEPSQMWSFEELFKAVDDLIHKKKVVNVFSVCTCSSLKIYISKTANLAKFKEAIAEQTDLRPSNQLLLFDHDRFENIVQPLHLIHTYPRTTTYSPVFVYSKEAMDFGKLPFNDIENFPKLERTQGVEMDVITGKKIFGITHCCRREVQYNKDRLEILTKGVRMLSAHYNRSIEDLQKQCCSIALQQSDQEKRVTGFEQCHQRELRLFRVIYHHTVVQEGMAIFDDCQETTNKLRDNYSKFEVSLVRSQEKFQKLDSQWVSRPDIRKPWDDSYAAAEEKSLQTMCHLQNQVQKVYNHFVVDKEKGRLNHNEEQIHKYERKCLGDNCDVIVTVVDDSRTRVQRMYDKCRSWANNMARFGLYLSSTESQLKAVNEELVQLSKKIDEACQLYSLKINQLLTALESTGSSVVSVGKAHDQMNNMNGSSKKMKEKTVMKEMRKEISSLSDTSREVRNVMKDNTKLLEELSSLTEQRQGNPDGDSDSDEMPNELNQKNLERELD